MESRFLLLFKNKNVYRDNTINMNQILLVKKVNKTHKRIFLIQFIVSIIFVIYLSFNYFIQLKKEKDLEVISQTLNKSFEVESVYKIQKTSLENQDKRYFGKIIIPKIKLEYSVFNECNDELLKILPCKFYGKNIEKRGNVCIAGHNYNDDRFFGNLSHLNKNDIIYLNTENGKKYQYYIYDIYKVESDDFECLKSNKMYELTLLTCDNKSGKRLVVKASRN